MGETRGRSEERGKGGFIHSFSHPVCDSLEVSHLAALAFVCLLASTRFPRESVLLKSSCTRLTVGHHSSQNQSLEGRVHDSWFQVPGPQEQAIQHLRRTTSGSHASGPVGYLFIYVLFFQIMPNGQIMLRLILIQNTMIFFVFFFQLISVYFNITR